MLSLRPNWWEEAKPYFIYGGTSLQIKKDAPKELKKKFNDYMKGSLCPTEVTLFKSKDFRIRTYYESDCIWVEIDEYYTLKGFWGDEDYYQYYIIIEDSTIFDKFRNKSKYQSSTLLCIKEQFHSYKADIDIMKFCQENNVPFVHFNRISGGIRSDDKEKMNDYISRLSEDHEIMKRNKFIQGCNNM